MIELFYSGSGIEGQIQGTAWVALQAFSEYADHHKGIRATKGKSADAARLESIWPGSASILKRQALAAIADQAQVQLAAA
ncbi:MAG: DUF932 domain-containing protein [Myxococcaceae bacterium]|nr:DUF932 domain-containing protein [Myxococcaceae bacterium]